MKIMKVAALCFAAVVSVSSAFAQDRESKFSAVANSELKAEIAVNGERLGVSGRVSMSLEASPKEIEAGSLNITGMNMVFFNVKQGALTYGETKREEGHLSFVSAGDQQLAYFPEKGLIEGTLKGFVGADYMGAYATQIGDQKGEDSTRAPRQSAKMRFSMRLEQPFLLKESEKPRELRGEANVQLVASADQIVRAHDLRIVARPALELEYAIFWRFEVAKRLCVQPVRFSRLVWNWPSGGISMDYTGAGLGFGKPEADAQWKKADVLFTWRDWKTVYNPSLFFFSTSEWSDVLGTVDDDDCVEVFFVEGDDNMHNSWGGGANFNSGDADTKIISSDGNVDAGVDFNHLAHELGHAMDLPHPSSFNKASTNTLMCPSGFANDNPDRNSEENKAGLANPLFTFALKFVSAGPDCTNDADCGACPPIP